MKKEKFIKITKWKGYNEWLLSDSDREFFELIHIPFINVIIWLLLGIYVIMSPLALIGYLINGKETYWVKVRKLKTQKE